MGVAPFALVNSHSALIHCPCAGTHRQPVPFLSGSRATCLVAHRKPEGETGPGFRHIASEVLRLLRQVGTTEHRSRGAAETATRNLLQKGCPVIQRGILVFTLTSIRRKQCAVKYLYYLIYYYKKQKYIFVDMLRKTCNSPLPGSLLVRLAVRIPDGEKWAGQYWHLPSRAFFALSGDICRVDDRSRKSSSHFPRCVDRTACSSRDIGDHSFSGAGSIALPSHEQNAFPVGQRVSAPDFEWS